MHPIKCNHLPKMQGQAIYFYKMVLIYLKKLNLFQWCNTTILDFNSILKKDYLPSGRH
jgi:hypothetical protein